MDIIKIIKKKKEKNVVTVDKLKMGNAFQNPVYENYLYQEHSSQDVSRIYFYVEQNNKWICQNCETENTRINTCYVCGYQRRK